MQLVLMHLFILKQHAMILYNIVYFLNKQAFFLKHRKGWMVGS
jgi:hypothetical protein